MPRHPAVLAFLVAIDEAYDKSSWHGPNLRGALRGLRPEAALWRPGRDRHNVWELVLHAAYWKYVARRRLTGEKRGSFSLAGSNFVASPVRATPAAWKEALAVLATEHRSLRAAVEALAPTRPSSGQERLLRGIVAHDLYHAGQIQLLKRLRPASKTA